MKPDFKKGDGLLPAIIQDAETGAVLMLGYMNKEALAATQSSGHVTFYSRSKQRLWEKGEESGNTLVVQDVRLDCDADTILVRAKPTGPVCHTGEDTCFGPGDRYDSAAVLAELGEIIRDRHLNPKGRSYTSRLFEEGIASVARKVGEEAVELVVEALGGTRRRVQEEAADLVYHLIVLLESRNLTLDDILAELESRRR